MNTHFIHLNPELFPDPYRWLRAEKTGETAQLEKHFHPFGKGTRNCLGLKYVSIHANC